MSNPKNETELNELRQEKQASKKENDILAEARGLYRKEVKDVNNQLETGLQRLEGLKEKISYLTSGSKVANVVDDVLFGNPTDQLKRNAAEKKLNQQIEDISSNVRLLSGKKVEMDEPAYFNKLVEKVKQDSEYRQKKEEVKNIFNNKVSQAQTENESDARFLKSLVSRMVKKSLNEIDNNVDNREQSLKELTTESSISKIIQEANEALIVSKEKNTKLVESKRVAKETEEKAKADQEKAITERKQPKSQEDINKYKAEKKSKKENDDILAEARGLYNKEVKETNEQFRKNKVMINNLQESITSLNPDHKLTNFIYDLVDGKPTAQIDRTKNEKKWKEEIQTITEQNKQLAENLVKLNEPNALEPFIEQARKNAEERKEKKSALSNIQKIRETSLSTNNPNSLKKMV